MLRLLRFFLVRVSATWYINMYSVYVYTYTVLRITYIVGQRVRACTSGRFGYSGSPLVAINKLL